MSQNPFQNGPQFFGQNAAQQNGPVPHFVVAIQQQPLPVTAAFKAIEYLHHFRQIHPAYDGGANGIREFSKNESALWNASLDTLRLFISGEHNFENSTEKDKNIIPVKKPEEDEGPGFLNY